MASTFFYYLVQCNSKLKNNPVVTTSIAHSQTSETDVLMKLILNNFSSSGNIHHTLNFRRI